MEGQNKFLELLEDIKGIAKAQDSCMTKQELQSYLSDMHLSEEQWKAVYQYLGVSGIRVEGYRYIPESELGKSVAAEIVDRPQAHKNKRSLSKTKKNSTGTDRAARNRYLYQLELQKLSADRMEVPIAQIQCFLQGERDLRDRIIESRLSQVVEIAERYRSRSVPVEELIAEGNLGLLYGMSQIEAEPEKYMQENGMANAALFLETLEQAVIAAMEQMIDAEMEAKDQESSMLAKTNLLHEAAKFLTEELGRVPLIKELSDYTRTSEEEIRQIMGLSEDAKRIASPS